MFIGQRKSVDKIEPSSDEDVFRFPKKVKNIIVSSSSSENENLYESEDFEELLENLAIKEENEQIDTVGSSDNIQWKEFIGKEKSFEFIGEKWTSSSPLEVPVKIQLSSFSLSE